MSQLMFSNNFEVEYLGVQDIDVYDIEVEDNHNFFANDICVHNSVYINFEPLINQVKPEDPINFLEDLGDKVIAKVFEKAFKELYEQQNAYTNRMWMGREVIASSGFWTGKKKYALAVMNKDGITYSEPKVKITGLSAIQSSTPAPCRKWLKDIFMIILEGDQNSVIEFIDAKREEFYNLSPEDIARNSSVSDISKYTDKVHIFKKGTPINTRASILYNKAIQDNDLTHLYHLIKEGEKMKYVYMNLPNPLKQNVLGFKDIFPRELGYDKYIDYDTQFEKVFLTAVDSIMEAVGWRNDPTVGLDSFFV